MVATQLADLIDSHLNVPLTKPALLYYFAAGSPLEERINRLPEKLDAFQRRERLASTSTAPIDAYLEIAPALFKDTIYD
jgi:hypothetical protein